MAQFPIKNGLLQGTLDGTPISGTVDLSSVGLTGAFVPSQNFVLLDEDFIGGTNADGQIGLLGWRQANISGSGAFAYVTGTLNNPGQYQTACAAASGNASSLYLGGSALTPFIFVDATTPIQFELRITFKLNQTTVTRFRLGIMNDSSAVTPGRGEYLRYDTSIGDTNFMAVVKDGGAETASSLGVAVDTNWHTLRIRNTGTNLQYKMSMNTSGGAFGGEVTVTNTNGVGGITRYIAGIVGNDATAAAKSFIIDAVKFRAIVSR
jgi:hypothetical protein